MQSTKQRQHTPVAALLAMALGWALLGSAAKKAIQAGSLMEGEGWLAGLGRCELRWQRGAAAGSSGGDGVREA